MRCQISLHGLYVKASALVDTGAAAYLLINKANARKFSECTGASIDTPKRLISVNEYDGKRGTPVTRLIRILLHIDGRVFILARFLLLDMTHDLILGNIWLADHDIGLRPSSQQQLWLKFFPPTLNFARTITLTWASLRSPTPVLDTQEDVTRRYNTTSEFSEITTSQSQFRNKYN